MLKHQNWVLIFRFKPVMFATITRVTKRLDIVDQICSAPRKWNYVVTCYAFLRAAMGAATTVKSELFNPLGVGVVSTVFLNKSLPSQSLPGKFPCSFSVIPLPFAQKFKPATWIILVPFLIVQALLFLVSGTTLFAHRSDVIPVLSLVITTGIVGTFFTLRFSSIRRCIQSVKLIYGQIPIAFSADFLGDNFWRFPGDYLLLNFFSILGRCFPGLKLSFFRIGFSCDSVFFVMSHPSFRYYVGRKFGQLFGSQNSVALLTDVSISGWSLRCLYKVFDGKRHATFFANLFLSHFVLFLLPNSRIANSTISAWDTPKASDNSFISRFASGDKRKLIGSFLSVFMSKLYCKTQYIASMELSYAVF